MSVRQASEVSFFRGLFVCFRIHRTLGTRALVNANDADGRLTRPDSSDNPPSPAYVHKPHKVSPIKSSKEIIHAGVAPTPQDQRISREGAPAAWELRVAVSVLLLDIFACKWPACITIELSYILSLSDSRDFRLSINTPTLRFNSPFIVSKPDHHGIQNAPQAFHSFVPPTASLLFCSERWRYPSRKGKICPNLRHIPERISCWKCTCRCESEQH